MEHMLGSAQSGVDVRLDAVRPAVPLRGCLLAVGQDILIVDLNHVREVFRVESITPVPGLPSALVGVANLRGTVILLADLRVFMGMPRTSKPKYAAVVGQGHRQVGLLINDVPEIIALDTGDVAESVSQESAKDPSFLSGRIHLDGRTGSLMELSKLLAVVESITDQQGQEFMIGDNSADTDERAVLPEGHRTTSDGEENDHGEA